MLITVLLTMLTSTLHADLSSDDVVDIMRRKHFILDAALPAQRFLESTEVEGLHWLAGYSPSSVNGAAAAVRELSDIYQDALMQPTERRAEVRSAERRVRALMDESLRQNSANFGLERRESRVHDLLSLERSLAEQTGFSRPDLHEALDLVAYPELIMTRAANRTLNVAGRRNVYTDDIRDHVLLHFGVTAPRRALEIAWAWDDLPNLLGLHILTATGMELGDERSPFRIRPAEFGTPEMIEMTKRIGTVGVYVTKLIAAHARSEKIRAEISRLSTSKLRAQAFGAIDDFERSIVDQLGRVRGDVETYASAHNLAVEVTGEQWTPVLQLCTCTRALITGRE